MNPTEQKAAAKRFVERWKAAEGNEQREANKFWIELLQDVLGVPNATHVLDFERKVRTRRVDVFYEDIGILIENKSRGCDLDKRYERGNTYAGEARMVTPYEQARWYEQNMVPRSIRPRWIITCNFDEIRIYDTEKEYPERSYETILLDELPEQIHRLSLLVRKENSRLEREKDLSVEAGRIVGRLYDALAKQYLDIENDAFEQHSLNVLITRIVFLLYAEDAVFIKEKSSFYEYLREFPASHMRTALQELFDALASPESKRSPYLTESLKGFPYVNGGLFDEQIAIPQFDDAARFILLQEASAQFDWEKISPTIFGAMFESTLNPETRRSGGMHYTSVENIHKVTGPLFYDELKKELSKIEGENIGLKREMGLKKFQKKLAGIKVLDPACGSGNFLTETYLSLRKLENRVINSLYAGQMVISPEDSPVMVSIQQFYGIEINDFAVEVAKTALWIAELQMLKETMEIIDEWYAPFPLVSNDNIHCANALRIDWNDVVPAEECSYVIGNPPFIGYSNQTPEQKEEMRNIWIGENDKPIKAAGKIDYVSAWYYKASHYMKGYGISAAFVSTNSICQGDQVAPIWETLASAFDTRIIFAWKAFVWNSEATDQAHVHVVIVGFTTDRALIAKRQLEIYDASSNKCVASNINGYLSDAPNVFVKPCKTTPSGVPFMQTGNRPADGGHLIIEVEDFESFVADEPGAVQYIRPFLGSREFINGATRWCLWLADASQEDIQRLPKVAERVELCRQDRLAAPDAGRQKLAAQPHLFREQKCSDHPYLVVPKVSSERRLYIPIGYVSAETICSDLLFIVPGGNVYEFAIISSQMHNAWMRVVAGRLKSDYRYSQDLVYNTFPWPNPTPEQRGRIEACAQAVLDAREQHPDASLATLYDPNKMPTDLLAAHKALDAAVEAAYGVDFGGDEEKIVAHLFKLYAEVTGAR